MTVHRSLGLFLAAACVGAPLSASPQAEAATPLDSVTIGWIDSTLASLDVRAKAGQLVMPWVGGEYAAVGSPEFEQLRRWVEDDGIGGFVISVGTPLAYAVKTNEMQRRARVPLLVAADMENGPGMRLGNIYALPYMLSQGGGTVFPPVMGFGATGSEELAYRLGEVLGREARAVGVHMTFGPVLDVNSNPLNPIINTRSFGEDPDLVSRMAGAYIRGTRATGLLSTGKHFPGHGDTHLDSHIELPTIPADRARLDTVELPPFRAAVAEGVDAIMTAHIAMTGVEGPDAPPATLSPVFMTAVLRDELQFSGLLFTDAMSMGAVTRRYGEGDALILALEAGADVLLMPRSVEDAIKAIVQAVESGRVPESRIDTSVRRILEAKVRAGLHERRLVDVEAVQLVVNVPAHSVLATEVAERSIVLAHDQHDHVPLPGNVSRILSVTYSETSDLVAGRTFDRELRNAGYTVMSARVDERTTADEYAALRARADTADVVIASAYVSPRDSRGTIGAGGDFTAFVQELASGPRPIVTVSFGSPYLLNAFPTVPAYMLAWGGAPVSQAAAANALAGRAPITGRLPVSLPPLHQLGDGLHRDATRAEN